ncbi:ERAD-associated protein [Agyrium rufum]|nr:ERAD-associated protein [Agyrium rufum]
MYLRSVASSRARSWRGSILFMVTLLAIAWAQQDTVGDARTSPSSEHVASRSQFPWRRMTERNTTEGDFEYQDAISILRSIENPQSRLARLEKSSGLLGTSIYYAKEAFIFLFMNTPKQEEYLDTNTEAPRLEQPLARAVQLLERAASYNKSDAIFLLAEMNFHGNYSHPRSFREAFKRYEELASLNGNSTAQHMLGFMYATGIGGATEINQAKSLLYHTFAAKDGNTRSEMTAAFRHHAGIGTARNCDMAARYYKKVADKAIAYATSGPPLGRHMIRHAYRIADEDGGVYGEGASVISAGINANRATASSDQGAAFDDVLEYLDLMSRKGDLKATFSLGRLHYDGSRTMRRNLKTAQAYFVTVARKYWASNGSVISDDLDGTGRIAAKAASYLGRMYLRGEAHEQSYEKASMWFQRGVRNGDSGCQHGLGYMHLHGLGVPKNPLKAASLFKAAAEQDRAVAQVALGKLFLDQGDLPTAMQFFEMAIRHGEIEAFYYLAEISNKGVGRERSCGIATAYYKVIAEKAEGLHSAWEEANKAYADGDTEAALVNYMMAAEQGYENAQANVAYLLDHHKSILSFDWFAPWKQARSKLLDNARLALIYWTRSAKQTNIDSMVKMGDYYLGGYGIEADMEKAATCYQGASEMQASAQALWNLGWMHENGIGVEQDFHLAKRFYDQALETNREAYMPVKLSLLKLRLRSKWNDLTHGNVKSIQPEPEVKKVRLSWSEWLSKFLSEPHPYYANGDDGDEIDDLSDPLFHDPLNGGDEYYDDIDESIVESLIIVALAGALAFLVYFRQQRVQNQRRDEAMRRQEQMGAVDPEINQEGQDGERGYFPPREDPAFADWVAGGIGH